MRPFSCPITKREIKRLVSTFRKTFGAPPYDMRKIVSHLKGKVSFDQSSSLPIYKECFIDYGDSFELFIPLLKDYDDGVKIAQKLGWLLLVYKYFPREKLETPIPWSPSSLFYETRNQAAPLSYAERVEEFVEMLLLPEKNHPDYEKILTEIKKFR